MGGAVLLASSPRAPDSLNSPYSDRRPTALNGVCSVSTHLGLLCQTPSLRSCLISCLRSCSNLSVSVLETHRTPMPKPEPVPTPVSVPILNLLLSLFLSLFQSPFQSLLLSLRWFHVAEPTPVAEPTSTCFHVWACAFCGALKAVVPKALSELLFKFVLFILGGILVGLL